MAETVALAWVMVGTSRTMMAVMGATAKLGLMTASNASGATAIASTASRPPSLECGTSRYSTPESNSDQRTDHIIDCSFDRPADTRLRHEGGREPGPEGQAKL
jgi:hypothetical protein